MSIINKFTYLVLVILSILILAHGANKTSYFKDFGDPNGKNLASALRNVKKQEVRIIQFGDSHTAAEFITEDFRNKMQKYYGIGSEGWLPPMQIPGQRSAYVSYKSSGFKYINSLVNPDKFNYGGVIANSTIDGQITVNKRNGEFINSKVSINARCKTYCEITFHQANREPQEAIIVGDKWTNQVFNLAAGSSFTINTSDNISISGIYVDNKRSGVSVSAMGINSSTILNFSKWETDWEKNLKYLKPNLIILAFGTNESFQHLDLEKISHEYTTIIARIRNANPKTAILILSNPDSYNLRNIANNDTCNRKADSYVVEVNKTLTSIAQRNKTLFWNWRDMMGGKCSMGKWLAKKLSNDGIHFTSEGYHLIGEKLATDLINWAINKK